MKITESASESLQYLRNVPGLEATKSCTLKEPTQRADRFSMSVQKLLLDLSWAITVRKGTIASVKLKKSHR